MNSAEEITRQSRSNLALAFIALPKERRQDITVFYAFCRVIDDIADEPGRTKAEKEVELRRWRDALSGPVANESALATPMRDLISKYNLSTELVGEIINGVSMDIDGASYATWEDLRTYCYRVASAVGLVSLPIFGSTDPKAREYAINLGLALQLTNIIRDVGQDFTNDGRIYLPEEDLRKFGYTKSDLAEKKHHDALKNLLTFQAERATALYNSALQSFPENERRVLAAAETMRRVYSELLSIMQNDGFRVLDRRYSVGKISKLRFVARGILQGWTG